MSEQGDDGERFAAARKEHEAILEDPDSVPLGWVEQARFRDRYDLPPFRPPRFKDGTRVRTVVVALEQKHDIDLAFIGGESADGWAVEADGNPVLTVERHRDAATNVVVPVSPTAFRRAVEAAVSE